MKYTRIQSFQHLQELVAAGKSEYVTVYGILRCSYSIEAAPNRRAARHFPYLRHSLLKETGSGADVGGNRNQVVEYELFSYVDGSCCRLTAAQLEERFQSAIATGRMAMEE